ncbi:MAG TPA: hypothetical protein VI636_21080 [Candidatus Angelobacter sp.]
MFYGKEGRPRTIRLLAYSNGDEIRDAIIEHARAARLLTTSLDEESSPSQRQTGERGGQPDRA